MLASGENGQWYTADSCFRSFQVSSDPSNAIPWSGISSLWAAADLILQLHNTRYVQYRSASWQILFSADKKLHVLATTSYNVRYE